MSRSTAVATRRPLITRADVDRLERSHKSLAHEQVDPLVWAGIAVLFGSCAVGFAFVWVMQYLGYFPQG